MSSYEHDFSEGSGSSWTGSPYSSPPQHVLQLADALPGISFSDDASMHGDIKMPLLRIAEQPQDYFRFRYKSEMEGTHGCLLGKSATAKNKTNPTVELVNYTGAAVIRCRLSQVDKEDEHPHKLFHGEEEHCDVSFAVPECGSYKVSFAGMAILHTVKKDVPKLLFRKHMEEMKDKNINFKELHQICKAKANDINLNVVRLRFSAHDAATEHELCPPVFSENIHNLKSAAVNTPKICRMDRLHGSAQGGDKVFLLVDKVNKNNIKICLFERDGHGQRVWSADGIFTPKDVHYQYAIVFSTPPYRDPDTPRDVKVYIELQRPSDGRTSNSMEFKYKRIENEDPDACENKRKRTIYQNRPNSSHSSLENSSDSPLKSLSESLPTPVDITNQNQDRVEGNPNVPEFVMKISPMLASTSSNGDLGDALYSTVASESVTIPARSATQVAPMLSQPNVPEPPVINTSELERLTNPDILLETDWPEYSIQFINENLSDNDGDYCMDFIRHSFHLLFDSDRYQADPTKSEENNQPAWQMCLNRQPVLRQEIPSYRKVIDDDIKSQTDDEFESVDDYESTEEYADEDPLIVNSKLARI